jgi:hypothetical protein
LNLTHIHAVIARWRAELLEDVVEPADVFGRGEGREEGSERGQADGVEALFVREHRGGWEGR